MTVWYNHAEQQRTAEGLQNSCCFNINVVKRKKNMTGSFSSKLYIKNNSHRNDPETSGFFMYSVLFTQFASMKTEESHLEMSEVE